MSHRLIAEIAFTILLLTIISSIYIREALVSSLIIHSSNLDLMEFSSKTKLYHTVFTIDDLWNLISEYEVGFQFKMKLNVLPALNITFIPKGDECEIYVKTWSGNIIPFINISISRINANKLIEHEESEVELGYLKLNMTYNENDTYVIFANLFKLYTFKIIASNIEWLYDWMNDYIRNETRVNDIYLIIPHYREPLKANWDTINGYIRVVNEPGTVAYILITDNNYIIVPRIPIPYETGFGKIELLKYIVCNIDGINYMATIVVRT